MRKLVAGGLSVAVAASIAVAPVDAGPARALTASPEVALAATVLTLEGGLVGIQHLVHFTPMQLQGSLCKAPNTCQPVDYPAWPLGDYFNKQGAALLNDAIAKLPVDAPVVPFGHSQGGQVIYAAVRGWTANPTTAPDPSRLSWVSIGNPENAFGGTKRKDGLPPDTPYQGTEVIKQYDGWADWPTGPFNILSVLNAVVGMNTTHVTGYFNVDLNSPDNIRYIPDKADGTPGNITYVFVPNPTLPLIAMTGPFAPLLNPILDPILRPIVESGYNRPIGPVDSAGVSPPAAQVVSTTASAARVAAPSGRPGSPTGSGVKRTVSGALADKAQDDVSPEDAKRHWDHSSHIVRH